MSKFDFYVSYESWEKDFFTIPNLPDLEKIMDGLSLHMEKIMALEKSYYLKKRNLNCKKTIV